MLIYLALHSSFSSLSDPSSASSSKKRRIFAFSLRFSSRFFSRAAYSLRSTYLCFRTSSALMLDASLFWASDLTEAGVALPDFSSD